MYLLLVTAALLSALCGDAAPADEHGLHVFWLAAATRAVLPHAACLIAYPFVPVAAATVSLGAWALTWGHACMRVFSASVRAPLAAGRAAAR